MISLILSGGAGTRLWPVSRLQSPKQFAPLFESSLFSQTAKRLENFGPVWLCSSKKLKDPTQLEIFRSQLAIERSLFEPVGRNTAPAVGLFCRQLELLNLHKEVVGVFPADHFIEDEKSFQNTMAQAKEWAEQDHIVTLGIVPTYPATGYGYIQVQQEEEGLKEQPSGQKVLSFKEKPNASVAKEYLQRGGYYWNSGMFVFKASRMIEAFKKWMPEMWENLQLFTGDDASLERAYEKVSSESLDYGIMEKAKRQVCIPCSIGWSDLGAWDDIAKFSKNSRPDFEVESSDCFSFSTTARKVSVVGLSGVGIVDTDDALLVYGKGHSQSVKELVQKVDKSCPQLVQEHTWDIRPWGHYRSLLDDSDCKVKIIEVQGGQQLSYQSHSKRSETWVVVAGKGEVVLDGETIPLSPGSVVQIPVKAKHRMRNPFSEVLRFVEIQQGSYFGEDDIVRYEDDYQRI